MKTTPCWVSYVGEKARLWKPIVKLQEGGVISTWGQPLIPFVLGWSMISTPD